MGLSTGMKIGMAQGFMARKEIIENKQTKQTEDFRKVTAAATKSANSILRKEDEIDKEETQLGLMVLQNEVLSPILKDKMDSLSPAMIMEVGRSYKIHNKAGSTLKSIAIDLKNKIVNKHIQLDKEEAEQKSNNERQELEIKVSKETPRKFLDAIAQSFSPSASGEADRKVISEGMTEELKEIKDRNYTLKERKSSLGLSPKKILTPQQQKNMTRTATEAIVSGDTNVTINADGGVDYSNGDKDGKTFQKIRVANALITTQYDQYAPEEVTSMLQAMQNLEEAGYDYSNKNVSKLIKDIRIDGAKNVIEELTAEVIKVQTSTRKVNQPEEMKSNVASSPENNQTYTGKFEDLDNIGETGKAIKDEDGKIIGTEKVYKDSKGKLVKVTRNSSFGTSKMEYVTDNKR